MTAIQRASFLLLLLLAGCVSIGGDAWFKFGGTVADPDGDPISGAKVSISVDGKLIEQGGVRITDAQGQYKFFESSCPCNFQFTLDVIAEGFKPYALNLGGKQANGLVQHDVTLVPE